MPIQHGLVNGSELVGQGLYLRGVDGYIGIEKMRQANTKGFGGQPEQVAISVKGESAGWCDFAELRLIVSIEDAVTEAVGALPGHLDSVGTVGASGDDFDGAFAVDAGEAAAGDDGF